MFFILQVKYDVGLFAIHKYIISTLQKITSKLKYCLCRRRTWSCVANRQMGFQDTVYSSFVESLFVLMMHGGHVYFRKKRMKVVDCTLLVEEIIDEVPLHLLVCIRDVGGRVFFGPARKPGPLVIEPGPLDGLNIFFSWPVGYSAGWGIANPARPARGLMQFKLV